MPKIILASKSPRRVELLGSMGYEFDIVPSSYAEQLDESRHVEDVAVELALGKALDVAKDYPDALVIGSDTIVSVDDRQLGKLVDIDDARAMLLALAGRESAVSTGVAVVHLASGKRVGRVATTRVYFWEDSPEIQVLRDEYLATGDWKDKAGGYGIQSGAAPLIERIDGDYDTIVGLPTRLLAEMLAEFDLN